MAIEERDVIIIGGGPAGLTTAIYSSRSRLDTVVLERGLAGGQMAITENIENYPGFPGGIAGMDLAMKMREQAESFGAVFETGEVTEISREKDHLCVGTAAGLMHAKAVLIATGTEPRKLKVPGESEYRGRGVSYCATCDGAFFREKDLVVVGGGDSAVQESLYLTRFAKRVTIVHRRDEFRAERILQERAVADPKIDFVWDTELLEIAGNDVVEKVITRNRKSGEEGEISTDGVFIFVGLLPNTDFLSEDFKRDGLGFLVTDEHLMTSVEGVWAAGDVRANSFKQVAVAVGEGAIAAGAMEHHIQSLG